MNIFVRNTSSAKYSWRVNRHARYPDPLLHDLKPYDELDSTARVELARADTEKHGEVGLGFGRFPLEFGNVTNVLEFGIGLASVLARLPTKAAKNVTRFVLAAHLHEPTWGLREDPNDCQEEKEREDLECNWEAPDEGAITTCIELASTKDGCEPLVNKA